MVLRSHLQSLGWTEWGPQDGNVGGGPTLQVVDKAAGAATLGVVQSREHGLGLSPSWHLILCRKKNLLVPVFLVN